MSESMQASILLAPGRMEIQSVPVPDLAPNEVRLRTTAVGLCGTDFHIYSGAANYNLDRSGRPVPLERHPQILGHEICGEIVELGKDVRDLKVGDRVIADQGLNCLSCNREVLCDFCQSGDSHQCEFYREHGITGLQGALAEYINLPSVNAIDMKPGLPQAHAALTEPLACVLHTADVIQRASSRFSLQADDPSRRVQTVLICGGGPAGLLFLQFLRRVLGFQGEIVLSELQQDKRQLAEAFGAKAVNPREVHLAEYLRELTQGRQAELIFEATGSGPLFLDLPGYMRRQATLVLYGHGHEGVGLESLNQVQWREPTMLSPIGASGGFELDGRPSVYQRSLHMIEDHQILVEPLISHSYHGLKSVPEAFGGDHRKPGYVKGVVLMES
ncbi:MAG: hypothetical protein DWQ01_05070 [Planctomycetota bacterium]|nr:MAG: hypothetical protein DWQ01_05070 [Planctomycetota bacterium]